MSTLKALQNNKITTSINHYTLEIRKWYIKLKEDIRKKRKIILAWIRAHKGIEGNEEVNKLAKETTEEKWDKELNTE